MIVSLGDALTDVVGSDFGQAGRVQQPRLVKAAHEFEGQMMKELMAPLESGKDLLGDDEEDSGSGMALSSLAGEALAKAISERGGFGIVASILRQLGNSDKADSESHAMPAKH